AGASSIPRGFPTTSARWPWNRWATTPCRSGGATATSRGSSASACCEASWPVRRSLDPSQVGNPRRPLRIRRFSIRLGAPLDDGEPRPRRRLLRLLCLLLVLFGHHRLAGEERVGDVGEEEELRLGDVAVGEVDGAPRKDAVVGHAAEGERRP